MNETCMHDHLSLYGGLIEQALDVGPLHPALFALVSRGAVRNLDAERIIDPGAPNFTRRPAEFAASFTLDPALTYPISQTVDAVAKEGFSPHFKGLMRNFARVMFTLFANDEQYARAQGWSDQGMVSCFMLTDAGGPSLAGWKSVLKSSEVGQTLLVDKVSIMWADKFNFALVAARNDGSMTPHIYLLSPEQCSELQRSNTGSPWLSGAFQLGKISGSVSVSGQDQLTRGGPTAINQLLTIVRPQFVRALLAYLGWMIGNGKLKPDATQRSVIEALTTVAGQVASCTKYSNLSVLSALALKFSCNELLVDLVASGCVPDPADQRDLLGFAKMEGSSYRCMTEIHARSVAANRVRPPVQRPSRPAPELTET